MRAFILGVLAAAAIAGIAAFASMNVDLSARHVYQAHDGSVRLSDR